MLEGKQSIISRSRRAFIRGRTTHVASLLVQAWPDGIAATEAALNAIPGVESHGTGGPGKLIITVDVDDDTGLVETVARIEAAPGVIIASLVYHQMDEGDAS
ncbi:chaperone NapD [Thalassospiraceae bacterium LMO-SO8]|nr:chaperone NapD [Alphaproteobacteria bacterium LMO-S08]WND77090.1 chaperone NapD [Thalassospiraceae bacterium LMO-SO8]